MLTEIVWFVLAYLLGSFSSGLLLSRLHGGVDIRQHGSGNIGATNVARALGKTAGLLTLFGDMAKGLVAVWSAYLWGGSSTALAAVVVGAVVGHLFPLYHGFRGGKGVATALGVLLPTMPVPLLGGLLVWVAVVLIWRYVSVASLAAALAVPVGAVLWGVKPPLVLAAVLVALLVVSKHRSNMQRLWRGEEPRFW